MQSVLILNVDNSSISKIYMEQLLLHLLGDYVTQNEWQAVNKTKNTSLGYVACLVHATLYSLPFLFLGSMSAFSVIYISHFFIDKYRLATYVVAIKNWNFSEKNFGFSESTPPWMSFWLLIIVDNILHLLINHFSLLYL